MQNELMPLHAIFLTFYALVFALVMGSFYGYHLYLVLYVPTSQRSQTLTPARPA
jgi:hypothetical protein